MDDQDLLPARRGNRPRTTRTNPHAQLDQHAEPEMVERLVERALELPGVEERPSAVSVPGARGFWLEEGRAAGPPGAFLIDREFAHVHPPPDGSLHMSLPVEIRDQALEKGWAEPHPLSIMGFVAPNVVMVYGPRDEEELEVALTLLRASRRAAAGKRL